MIRALAFLLLAAAFHFSAPVFAQENIFDFQRAYSDYTFTYEQYRQAHADYIIARQAYLNYKTLTSKNEAQSQTLRMLRLRDEVVRTYLTAIRLKLAETTGVSNYDQNILYLKLDDEINWYANNSESLPSAATLEDLVKSSKEVELRFPKTEVFIFQTLGAILEGKENSLRSEIDQQSGGLKEKVAKIRQNGDKSTIVLERWLLEAENRIKHSLEKQTTAHQLLADVKSRDKNKIKTYNQAQTVIKESHQYLKEANNYLKELIREAKRAD